MESKRTVGALLFVTMIASAALAQDVTSEFSRGTGGELTLLTKQARSTSGSLGISLGKSYEATLGGTLLEDRLWFFAAATHSRPQMPERAVSSVVGAKVTAQLGDRQNLAAMFSGGRESLAATPTMAADSIPSSFLSLHYTGIVSSNMFFTATVSRRTATQPMLSFAPFVQQQ